jgi:hypothetical protein
MEPLDAAFYAQSVPRLYNLPSWEFVTGDEKGSLKSGAVKYGRESQGTWTRERLRCQGPAVCKNYTHPLIREGTPQKSKP